MAARHTLFICTTCKRAGEAPLGPAFIDELNGGGLPDDVGIAGIACMSNCTRPLSVALASPGKATYMLAEIDPRRRTGRRVQRLDSAQPEVVRERIPRVRHELRDAKVKYLDE